MKRFLIISLFLAFAFTLSAQDRDDNADPKLYTIVNQAIESRNLEGSFDLDLGFAAPARGVYSGSDIDGDGNYEIIFTDYANGGKFHMFEVTGDNTAEWVYSSPGIGSSSSTNVRCVSVADLDGNGDMEVILSVNGSAGTDDAVMGLAIFEYSVAADSFLAPYFSNFDVANVAGNRYLIEGFDVADVDNDGVTEVIISNNGLSTYDQGYIVSFTGNFADQTAEAVVEFVHGKSSTTFPWNGSGMNATAGDLDGDGNMEAIFGVWDHGAVFVAEATAADTYEPRGYYQMDLNLADDVALDNIVTADLDDDGRDEVYTTLYSGGALRGLRITGEFDTATVANSVFTVTENGGSGAYGIAIGDLDGNGMMEIYSASYGSGNVIVHSYMGGDITDPANYEAATFGNHPTATGSFGLSTPGMDMDGDGFNELIVSYMEGGTIAGTAYEVPPPVINEFPYVQGFEDGVPPNGWTNADGYWLQGTEAHSGSYAAKVSYSHPGEAILETPVIELPANHKISFWWKDDDISKIDGNDTTYFEISMDGETWEVVDFLAATSTMSSYEQVEFDLSAYGDMNVYLRWRDVNDGSFSAYGTGLDDIMIEQISVETVDWFNLQWPGTAEITQGEDVTAYAQVYKAGLTDTTTVAFPGLEVWFGISTEDTDPATWEDWVPAEFNGNVGNNDEYMASFGADFAPGTYYYASRVRLNGGVYSYGGFSGGFWNGVDNVSGVLTVNAFTITEFPYVQDFEAGIMPPAGWANEDGLWNLGSESHAGAYAARVSYSHTGDAVLAFPAVTLPENMEARFWWKDDDITSADEKINKDKAEIISKYNELNGIEIAGHDTTTFEVSTDGVNWEVKAVLAAASSMSAYEEVSVDLSAYANMTVYMRFVDWTDASFSAYGTGIDDISIAEIMAGPPNPAVLVAPADGGTDIGIFPNLDWSNGGGDPTGYKVYLSDVNPPVDMVYDGDLTNYVVTEALAYSTEYFWQVVPYNDNGNAVDAPVWSFTTMDDPTLVPPFTQDFEGGYPPASWTRFSGLLEETSVLTTTTAGWIQDDFGNITDPVNKAARNNIYGSSRKHWLVTPPINLGDGTMTYQIDFDLALTQYANTNPATLGEDDKFAVVISVDNGLTWSNLNVLEMWDNSSVISNTGQHEVISLAGYTGIVKIGLYGESTVSNADNDLFVDNFSVGEAQGGSEIMFDVVAGWNMVSVPLMADDMATTSIFANAVSEAFYFDNGYASADNLMNGYGYWVKYEAGETITVTGMVPEGNIALNEGWNLIGPYDMTMTVADITTEPAGIITSSFFGYADNYFVATDMEPGMGYWVKTSAAGEIVVDAPAKKSPRQIEVTNSDWARLTITDANGRTATLYIADEDVQGFDLPPAPPVGAFDVRFTSGKYAQSLVSSQRVSLNSVVYPVKVRIDGADVKISDGMGGASINANLRDGEEVVISENIGSIEVANFEVPTEFNLAQNYPNPFNPATTIKFSLPVDSKVVIKVYNTLGEEVTTVLNRTIEAGYHEVNFNASNLTSGIYFYTIEAGEFTSVKKMVLLK